MENSQPVSDKAYFSSGELVSRAWQFYKTHFKKLWPLFLFGGIGETGLSFNISSRSSAAIFAFVQEYTGSDPFLAAAAIVCSIVVLFSLLLFFFFSKIALYKSISDLHKGEFVSIKDAYKKSQHLFWGFIFVTFLTVLAISGSFFLLIVPGIILSGYLTFNHLELVHKNKRGYSALTESWSLVKGRWWDTLIRSFLSRLILSLYSFLPALAVVVLIIGCVFLYKVSAVLAISLGAFVGLVFLLGVFLIFQPMGIIVFFMLYFNLVETKAEVLPPDSTLPEQRKNKLIASSVLGILVGLLSIVAVIILAFYAALHKSEKIVSPDTELAITTEAPLVISNLTENLEEETYVSKNGFYQINLPKDWNVSTTSVVLDADGDTMDIFKSNGAASIVVQTFKLSLIERDQPGSSLEEKIAYVNKTGMNILKNELTEKGLQGVSKIGESNEFVVGNDTALASHGSGSFGPPDYVSIDYEAVAVVNEDHAYMILSVWPEAEYGFAAKPIKESFRTFRALK